jgi:hypothetical protein
MFIGRDTELAAFQQILDTGSPAMLLLHGQPKVGKTALLQQFRANAANHGFTVLPSESAEDHDEPALVVDRTMTEARFCEALSLPLRADALDRSYGAGSTTTNGVSSNRDSATAVPGVSGLDGTHPGISSPTLLLIDNYRPSRHFEDWFVDTFLSHQQQDLRPLVLVISGYSSSMDRLRPLATTTMPLEALDTQAIERYLWKLNDTLNEKMEAPELHQYVDVLSKEPALIGALERLLTLGATT